MIAKPYSLATFVAPFIKQTIHVTVSNTIGYLMSNTVWIASRAFGLAVVLAVSVGLPGWASWVAVGCVVAFHFWLGAWQQKLERERVVRDAG